MEFRGEQISQIEDMIDREEQRLESYEEMLTLKYARLEMTMQNWDSIGSMLTSALSGLNLSSE